MFFQEDTTFRDIREKSIGQWIQDMASHEDITVRGGAKAVGDYIEDLKKQISMLEEKNALKDEYLKKLRIKRKDSQ
jgi:polyhydroxyalkanoate synthesis regulator phasin